MSDVYDTGDQLWFDLINRLRQVQRPIDSRNGPCYEVIGYSAVLTNPFKAWIWNPVRKASATYGAAELLWYLSGTDRVEMLERYAPSYRKFIGGHAYAKGAYGARIARNGQLKNIYDILSRDPDSRQAVMVMYWPEDQTRVARDQDLDDVPCTLSLQFLIRHGALNLVATMRSNDAWRGLPYDMWCFTRIQVMLAAALNVKVGVYVHNVGSMHIYENEMAKVRDVNRLFPEFSTGYMRNDHSHLWSNYGGLEHAIMMAVKIEEGVRKGSFLGYSDMADKLLLPTLLDECNALCAVHCGAPRPNWLLEGLK